MSVHLLSSFLDPVAYLQFSPPRSQSTNPSLNNRSCCFLLLVARVSCTMPFYRQFSAWLQCGVDAMKEFSVKSFNGGKVVTCIVVGDASQVS